MKTTMKHPLIKIEGKTYVDFDFSPEVIDQAEDKEETQFRANRPESLNDKFEKLLESNPS